MKKGERRDQITKLIMCSDCAYRLLNDPLECREICHSGSCWMDVSLVLEKSESEGACDDSEQTS